MLMLCHNILHLHVLWFIFYLVYVFFLITAIERLFFTVILVTVVLFDAVTATGPSRDVVSFDFGWKWRTGLHDWAPVDEPPPLNPDVGNDPAEAQNSYKDDNWDAVQLPHDGLIATAPSEKACPDGCSGKSYIPRHVMWYRKADGAPIISFRILSYYPPCFFSTLILIHFHFILRFSRSLKLGLEVPSGSTLRGVSV